MSLFNDLMWTQFNITCAMLGYDPTSYPQFIRPLDYTESPAGLKDPHTNMVFYIVQFTDEDINRQVDTIYSGNTDPALVSKKVKYCRNLRMIWQTYGDDGFEWADKIRINLLTSDDVHNILKQQGMSLIPDVSEPMYIPESIGEQWYKRYDLYADFNQLVVLEDTLPAVSGTDIIIETEKGVVGECSV